jgi:hypothetical protein
MTHAAQDEVRQFCAALFGGPDGTGDERLAGLYATAAWTLPDKRTRWTPADDAGAIASAALEAVTAQAQHDAVNAVFISAGLTAKPGGAKRRAHASEVVALVAISSDIDVAGVGHAAATYPPDFDAARSLVEAMGLAPSLLVNSGGGLHAWWIFDEPILFLTEDGELNEKLRDDVAKLAQDWNATLRYRADRHGWKIDSTFNLDRVMRLPGSVNEKDPANPHQVRIMHADPGARYGLDDFAAYLADPDVIATYTAGFGVESKTEALAGINVHELWARVNSADFRYLDHTPEWMAEALAIDAEGAGGKLVATWTGDRPDLGGDQSALDASLVRLLHDYGFSTERQVEALMCRRLRSGQRLDKIDPRKRTDYIARTVSRMQAKAAEAQATRDKITAATAAAATGKINSVSRMQRIPSDKGEPEPSVPPEPPADGQAPGDPFAEHVAEWIDYDPEQHPDRLPARETEAARDQVEAEHTIPAQRREKPVPASASERTPSPEPDPDDGLWGRRNEKTVTMMGLLSDLLIGDEYLAAGFEIWRLEKKDIGDAAKGRLVIRVPHDYDWPVDRPETYKPGRPLFTGWTKRSNFRTPAGFRTSLLEDAKITPKDVGQNAKDWDQLIPALAGYWSNDSSGTDLATQTVEWLLDYLLDHPALPDKAEAAQRNMPYLMDHREWGADGPPKICFPFAAFQSSVSARPGGPKGRAAKELLEYLHTSPVRPRVPDPANPAKTVRVAWQVIESVQFAEDDWAAILEAAYDAEQARAGKPRLSAVRSDGEGGRPSFTIGRRAAGGE